MGHIAGVAWLGRQGVYRASDHGSLCILPSTHELTSEAEQENGEKNLIFPSTGEVGKCVAWIGWGWVGLGGKCCLVHGRRASLVLDRISVSTGASFRAWVFWVEVLLFVCRSC